MAPTAPPVRTTDRVFLWTGAGLAALPPLLGLGFVLLPDVWLQVLFYSDIAGASAAQAVLRLLTELVRSLGSTSALLAWQPGVFGLALVLVGLRCDRRSLRAALVCTVPVAVGLVGSTAAVLGTLFPEPGVDANAATAALCMLFWAGMVALVVLALRRLRPSASDWALVGTALDAAVLLGTGYLSLRAGAFSAYDLVLSTGHVAGNFLGLAVVGAVVLWIVASRTRTLRVPVAVAGGLLLASWISLTALRIRTSTAPMGPDPGSTPTLGPLMVSSVAVPVLVLVALLVIGALLARRTRMPVSA